MSLGNMALKMLKKQLYLDRAQVLVSDTPGFEYGFCYFLARWPWASHLTFLNVLIFRTVCEVSALGPSFVGPCSGLPASPCSWGEGRSLCQ